MSAARNIIPVMAGVVGIYALFAADRKRRDAGHALPSTTPLPVAFYRGQQYARERCGGLVRTLLRLRTTLIAEEMAAPTEDSMAIIRDLGAEVSRLGLDLWLGTPTNGARWIPGPIIGVGDMRPEWLREAHAIASLPRDIVGTEVRAISPTAYAFEQGYHYEVAKGRDVRESFVALARIWKRPIDQDVSALVHRATVAHVYQRIVAALERYGLACRPLPEDWRFG